MNAFLVQLENKPGELARLTEAIADRGINITAISAAGSGTSGAIGVVTNDEAGTRQALDRAGITAKELELVAVALEDKPGTLAQAARQLADAGVNIELLLPTGMSGSKVTVAFGVDDAVTAKRALGNLVSVQA